MSSLAFSTAAQDASNVEENEPEKAAPAYRSPITEAHVQTSDFRSVRAPNYTSFENVCGAG